MIDITTTRAVALEMHPPAVILRKLGVLVLASALLARDGIAEARTRSWLHMRIYSAILSVAVYVILDLEYPRVGLIRIDSADHVLMDLRSNWKWSLSVKMQAERYPGNCPARCGGSRLVRRILGE